MIPASCQAHEIHVVDAKVSKGTIIMILTDGVHDYLPTQVSRQCYPNGYAYLETSIDADRFAALLTGVQPHASLTNYLSHLINHVVTQVDTDRQEKLSASESASIEIASLMQAIGERENCCQGNEAARQECYQSDWFREARLQLDQLHCKAEIQLGDDVLLQAVRLNFTHQLFHSVKPSPETPLRHEVARQDKATFLQ